MLTGVAVDQIFTTLANGVRRDLLRLLADGPRTAGALAGEFDLSRPAVSEHLHILEEAGLVVGVKRGRERHYHLNPAPLAELTEWLHPFERYWRDRLSDLAHLMENDPR
jgi:DNA-binding transcriptional ArsR family regulator